MLIALNKRRLQWVGEVSGEETPSPGCVHYITGAFSPIFVNESKKAQCISGRYIKCLTHEEDSILYMQ